MKRTVLIGSIFACFLMLMITTMLPITGIAGEEEYPEVEDFVRDVRLFGFMPIIPQILFKHVDIISIWLSEYSEDPNNLYVSMKLRNLEDKTDTLEAIYVVRWSQGEKIWGVSLKIHPHGIYKSPYSYRYYGHDNYSNFYTVDCNLDTDNNIITWQVPKDAVGNLKPNEVLTNIFGFTNNRHTEESGKLRIDLIKDSTDNAKTEKSYRVQY